MHQHWQRVLFHMIGTLSCTQCSSFTWGWTYFWSISCGCLSTWQTRTTGGCGTCLVFLLSGRRPRKPFKGDTWSDQPGPRNILKIANRRKQEDNPEWIKCQDCLDQQNLIKGHVPPRYFLWFPKLCILAKSWILLHQPVVIAVVLHQPVAVVLDLKTPD